MRIHTPSGAADRLPVPRVGSWVSLAPDGTSMAFAPDDRGTPGIHVARADGSTTAVIADGSRNHHPLWTPDGQHYQSPVTTGPWNEATRTGNCLMAPETDLFACGNMTRYYPEDPGNRIYQRPIPLSFEMNTGVGLLDERVWFGVLYVQDEWRLGRMSLSGARRYDHAESRYGSSCIGPDIFVPVQADGRDFWCSTPAKGVLTTT